MAKTIYIAGPMEGQPEYNYPKFRRWAEALRRDGWLVINPAEMSTVYGTPEQLRSTPGLMDLLIDDQIDAIEGKVDAILLLKGWESSKGARRELAAFLNSHMENGYLDYMIYTECVNPPPVIDADAFRKDAENGAQE